MSSLRSKRNSMNSSLERPQLPIRSVKITINPSPRVAHVVLPRLCTRRAGVFFVPRVIGLIGMRALAFSSTAPRTTFASSLLTLTVSLTLTPTLTFNQTQSLRLPLPSPLIPLFFSGTSAPYSSPYPGFTVTQLPSITKAMKLGCISTLSRALLAFL